MADEKQYTQITGAHDCPSPAYPSLAPPRYSFIIQSPEDSIVRADETSLANHTFSLPGGLSKAQPWVTLHIQTRPSNTIPKNPRFFGGDNVSGTIDLTLANPQIINSISIVVGCFSLLCKKVERGLFPVEGSDGS